MAGLKEQGQMSGGMDAFRSEKGDTWPKVLRYNHEKYGDSRRAMRHKHFGVWRPYTWKDYYRSVEHLALGLLSLGFDPGDKVLIIGDNAPHWFYAELAAQAGHGVSVGVPSDANPQEIRYIALHCEARFAIVQDQEQVDKLLEIKGELPRLEKIVYWNYKGLAHYDDPLLMAYHLLVRRGKAYQKDHPGIFEQNVASGKADEMCAIVYTSGATGDVPKGAVHTYQTMRAGAENILSLAPWHGHDNAVPYLPPAWMAEQWLWIGCHLLSGCALNFAEAPETRQQDMRETGPSIVFNDARIWERQASQVQARILAADPVKRWAFGRLMPIGFNRVDSQYRGQAQGLFQKLLHYLADVALFRPIRKSMGLSNAGICFATGAMPGPDTLRFYHALGLPLKTLYGSTEGGVFAVAAHENARVETANSAHQTTEVRISDEGELVYRQPGLFLGYYRDPDKTAEVLKEGWFYSGDSAFLREDGTIVVAGRLADIVKLSDGLILAPRHVESLLRFSLHIKEAWVLAGPEWPYVCAVIIIDYDSVSRWAGDRKVAFTSFAELSQAPQVYELVREDINRVNLRLPGGLQVKKYVNLPREFDPDEGELTRSWKLRRPFLKERYCDLIEAIYGDRSDVSLKTMCAVRNGAKSIAKTSVRIESVEGAGR